MDTDGVSSLVELTFALLRVNRPWNIRTWTEVSDGVDTAVVSVAQSTLLRDIARELQPHVRIQILMQDPPTAVVSDSTSELLSPRVVQCDNLIMQHRISLVLR